MNGVVSKSKKKRSISTIAHHVYTISEIADYEPIIRISKREGLKVRPGTITVLGEFKLSNVFRGTRAYSNDDESTLFRFPDPIGLFYKTSYAFLISEKARMRKDEYFYD